MTYKTNQDAPSRRFKCGDLHPDGSGRRFWVYDKDREWWVTPDKLLEKRAKHCAHQRARYAANPERFRIAERDRASANRELYNARQRERRARRREEFNANQRKYRAENRDQFNARRYERKVTDPQFRLSESLRVRLHTALNGKKRTKGSSQIDTPTILAWFAWLAKNGHAPAWPADDIHIDHVIPCAAWDLTRPGAIAAVNHWRNLFPMTKSANQSKSDRIDPHFIRKVWALADEFMINTKYLQSKK